MRLSRPLQRPKGTGRCDQKCSTSHGMLTGLGSTPGVWLAMISLTIVATLSAVGIILSIGLLIAPGAIAFLVTKRFEHMLVVSVLVTFVSGFLGIYVSFFIDSAPAPTIILILTGFFIAAFLRAAKLTRQATKTQT